MAAPPVAGLHVVADCVACDGAAILQHHMHALLRAGRPVWLAALAEPRAHHLHVAGKLNPAAARSDGEARWRIADDLPPTAAAVLAAARSVLEQDPGCAVVVDDATELVEASPGLVALLDFCDEQLSHTPSDALLAIRSSARLRASVVQGCAQNWRSRRRRGALRRARPGRWSQ